ncbi:phosphodiesterase [Vibrio sonorensis]|uniref:phosphodiesterase n=1 Tax=Vibrio sonorensis TaxID=1004316 RepID=UPI0008D929DE|nr:phosphodiesterase [Vibrio sonorensis]
MKVISHRGYWKEEQEKNSKLAFIRSFDLDFGTETDVRDFDGELVISHDIADRKAIKFKDFLDVLSKYNDGLTLALNIKSDGLASQILKDIESSSVSQHDFFVFDMSIPDMKSYIDSGAVPVFTRMSDVETKPAWLEESNGIWLDSFSDEWYSSKELVDILSIGKQVCIVSAELHKRDPGPQWEVLKEFVNYENLILCTDLPEDATSFFFDNYGAIK